MNTIERLFATLCLGATLSAPALASQPARFRGLGFGSGQIGLTAISADGTTVIDGAARWTAETGAVLLPRPASMPSEQPYFVDRAYAVSGDGRIVVGLGEFRDGFDSWAFPFIWTPEAGTSISLDPPFGELEKWTRISDDGLVLIGRTNNSDGSQSSSRWSAATGLELFPRDTWVADLSADGTVMAASMPSIYGLPVAARWTAEGGFVPFGPEPAEINGRLQNLHSGAIAISADGSTIVGTVADQQDFPARTRIEAFRWTQADGVQLLGELPDSWLNVANDVSSGGEVVVGISYGEAASPAFVWDARHGMRPLKYVLEAEFGLGPELSGWNLIAAESISSDGRAIAGLGVNPAGEFETYLVTLPLAFDVAPVAIDIRPGVTPNEIRLLDRSLVSVALLGSDALDVRDVDVATLGFGPTHAPAALTSTRLDVNRDGHRDLVAAFRVADSGIAFGDVEACLDGRDHDGLRFEGCDAVSTLAGCGRGFSVALLVPPLALLRRRRP